LYVHTNDTHENFRLATASLSQPGEWTTLVEGTEDFYLTGFDLFRDFYVTEGRVRGLDRIEVRYYDDPARIEPIAFPEASYEAGLSDNPEWTSTTLRLTYESMISPATVFDYNVAARTLERLKVQEIPSGYDPDLYWTQRLEIPARDGTLVPVSVMARKDRVPDTPSPLYLYGYGRAFPPGGSVWSIAAWCLPSRISAAAMTWGGAGTKTASSTSAPTRSTTLSMSPKG
jgi:oligopeptidase B